MSVGIPTKSLATTIKDTNNQGADQQTIGEYPVGGSAPINTFDKVLSDDSKVGLTVFHSDVVERVNANLTERQHGLVPVREQALADFMARPVFVQNGSWTTSSTYNTALYTAATIGSFFSNSVWANKLYGFENVRGTACLRLTLNANPFQQGRLILAFTPLDYHISASGNRFQSISQCTNLPHVEIDCRDGAGVLKVPYISPSHFYNLKTSSFDWGSFTVKVMAPLSTGSSGETSVQYAIALWFEDFEFATPLYPQMSGFVPKGARSKVRSLKGKEAEELVVAKSGVISRPMNLIANIASGVSASVPMMSMYAEPVSWIARGVGSVASWFGWSKPVTDTVPYFASFSRIPYAANSDGVSMAIPLALSKCNKVEYTDVLTPETFDEMSFEFLKRRFAYFGDAPWLDTQLNGTNIYSIDIGPDTLYEQFTSTHGGHTATMRQYPPFAYLSQMFKYNRGSIRFRIRFVKTDYHSGRLQVTFTPTVAYTTAPNLSTGAYSLREIVDIKGRDEVEFTLPYLFPYPWTQSSIGHLDIVVLNELRHPETAASSIQLLFYAAGGDDYELAVPVGSFAAPFVPQMDTNETSVVREVIGLHSTQAPGHEWQEPSRLTIGECFTSVKQLLNRYNCVNFEQTTPAAGPLLAFNPWCSDLQTIDPVSGAIDNPKLGQDMFSAIVSGYAFYRGSVRVAFWIPTEGNFYSSANWLEYTQNKLDFSPTSASATYSTNPNAGFGSVIYNTPIQLQNCNQGFTEMTVPYYNDFYFSLLDASAPLATTINSTLPDIAVGFNGGYGGTNLPQIYRAGSDDFQCGYFLGFYPILVSWS